MAYRIVPTPAYREDLRTLTATERSRIQAALPRYLADQPDQESSIRRPLSANPLEAEWELRLGNLRVFNDVNEDNQTVRILRAGRKVGNTLFIRGARIEMRFR